MKIPPPETVTAQYVRRHIQELELENKSLRALLRDARSLFELALVYADMNQSLGKRKAVLDKITHILQGIDNAIGKAK